MDANPVKAVVVRPGETGGKTPGATGSRAVDAGMTEIQQAAALIRSGQLVAFPTETVYGLGANALDAAAVDRIYEAKGRPPTSPLIVHVDSVAMARQVVSRWPEEADRLAARFWPGALTLVLPKNEAIPARVTAGLPNVGVRVPAHPLALALIRAAGVPIAAPSANRFGELSPTTAQHVRAGLGHRVSMILDGGPTALGIESTVLSLAGPRPVLLRPGMVPAADLESVVGPLEAVPGTPHGAHQSPGQHARHYSPRTPVKLVEAGRLPSHGRGTYLHITACSPGPNGVPMPDEPLPYAACLYSRLHEVDAQNWDWIAIERPPSTPAWAAIHDRLERAASL